MNPTLPSGRSRGHYAMETAIPDDHDINFDEPPTRTAGNEKGGIHPLKGDAMIRRFSETLKRNGINGQL
jgi:hypothetical protein